MSDSSRARKERAERIDEIGRQALKRLPQQQLAKGWNSWLLFAESRARHMQLLQASMGHMLHRKLAGGFHSWEEYTWQRQKMVRLLSEALQKLKYRAANSAFNAWQYATGTGEYAPSLLSACTRSPRRLSPHRYGRVCSFPPERRQAELVDVWPRPAGILV